jgi:hypothetical protein
MIKKRKVNAYDIVFFLIIGAVVFTIGVGLNSTRTEAKMETVDITFRIYNADSGLLSAIKSDTDILIENKFYAKHIDLSYEKVTEENLVCDKDKSIGNAEEKMILEVLVRTDCHLGEMGYLLDGLKYAVPNMDLTLSGKHFLSRGKIMKIEKAVE